MAKRKRLVLVSLTVFGVLAVGYVVSAWLCSSVILAPRRWTLEQAAADLGYGTPADFGCAYTDLAVPAGDITIRGWLVPAEPASSRAVILIHRVGENRVAMLPFLKVLRGLKVNTALIDLRTHGETGGEVLTCGVRERADVRAVVDWLVAGHLAEPGRVALIGQSLGGSVALQAAAEDDRVAAVVADGASAYLRPTVRRFAGTLFGPSVVVAPLAMRLAEWRGGYSAWEASPIASASRVRCPVLLIHGENDILVTRSEIEALQAALGSHAELWIIPGTDHCGGLAAHEATYTRRVRTFLEHHLG
jgi:dipeptidyl aminopeptidase/acylaminoacyl peptidase